MKLASTLAFAAVLTCSAQDWPQWRGPNRDGHTNPRKLAADFPQNLTSDWKIPVGGGHSSPVVAKGKLVYMDAHEGKETIHCLDAATGKEIWKQAITEAYSDEWGAGTRATPFIDEDRVYGQTCSGEFRCYELVTGKEIWKTSFENDWGVKFGPRAASRGTASRRGNNGAGIADADAVILPVGSTEGASIVAFDKKTGKVLWKSGNDEAAYSSLVVADLAGRRTIVAFNAEALTGHDRKTGEILWRVPIVTQAKRHAMTPVIMGDNVIVNTFTFGMASYLIQKDGEKFTPKQVWRNQDLKINLGTPVLVGGHLYNHGPSKDYVCVDAATGAIKWRQAGFGEQYSASIAMGDRVLVTTDFGELVVLKANPDKYEELGRAQLAGKSWSHPAIADGKLIIRDNRELAAYSIAAATR